MKRAIVAGLSLVVLALVLMAPALWWNGSDAANDDTADPTDITSYVAEFDLAADGDLDVVETLTVSFPVAPERQGIFRFFDRYDPTAPKARRIVEDVEVTMDGGPVEVDQTVRDRRYDVVRIGTEGEFVEPGEHVYEISYHIDGVLEPGTDGQESQFYWQLIPAGWAQDIQQARITVRLPGPAQGTRCVVGTGELEDLPACALDGDGTDTLTITTGALAPQTPVTLKTGIDLTTPEPGVTRPWTARFDTVLGPHVLALGGVGLLGVAAAVAGGAAARRSYEANPQFPLMYAPPEGIGPAQAKYILTESIDQEAYVATLMYAAEKGAIDLQKTGDAWTISDKQGPAGWAGLDEATLRVAQLLGGPGTHFVAAPKNVEAGQKLKSEIEDFESTVKEWATKSGLLTSTGLGGLGGLLVMAAFGAVLAIAIWNPLDMTMIGLVPGLFAVFATPLLVTGAATKRTRAGRNLWSQVGGFRRVLATPSSQDRFDFSGRQELYTAYVPWAVAFGCADEWAEKYRTETGAEPPAPTYFGAYAGAYAGSGVGSMVNDFDSTVSSAISSYQATQSSSSSGGGGGFSGGGGGGGGGGGSW